MAGFFGFDTSLPPVRKGSQQEFGNVELEDTHDALNDETFGVLNTDEDLEDAAIVAASAFQWILDDDDIESLISRPMNYSKFIGSKLFEIMSPPSSLIDSDIVYSPLTPSIWSTQPSEIEHHLKETSRSTPTNIPNTNLPPGSHHLHQNSLINNSIRSFEEIEAELIGNRNEKPVGVLPPPPAAHLRPPFMRPPVGILPPLGMPLPPYVRGMYTPGMPMNGSVILPQMGQLPPGFPPKMSQMTSNQPHQLHQPQTKPRINDQHRYHDDGYDEYAGLMSTKQKQWLTSIQINQLISDNPYVDDYYFTVLRLRFLGKLRQDDERKDGPKLILPERAKIEAKTYAPVQFENSLGKLQAVSYTAPRRILDVSIAPSSESGQDPQVAAKDLRNFKQILLDIEKMYAWLLDLEDAEIRVAEDSDPEPHHQAAADCQLKLQNLLSNGDRLRQVMYVRKGKILILRAWSRLSPTFQEIIVKTILLNCIALIRRDTNDHILVRFLPLVNECIASIVQLKGLLGLAQCLERAQKAVGDITITSTKVGLDLISLLMCRGSELFPRCQDEAVRNQWSIFVTNLSNSLLITPVLNSNLSLLTSEPFEQIGLDSLTLNKLKIALDQLGSSI